MAIQLYKLSDVRRITGKSRAAIYADMSEGKFPRPLKIGKRSVAWRSTDIEQWINGLPSA